ncbi:MAG: carotenoid biosynthesis protein [Flavobacteriaceae bacterium]|nr:carotenoid biosynthesis protein [Muriicola sp.]NNL40428.1 carotenoid biosynthesis protein [Flavobacteriaceae bacterium]
MPELKNGYWALWVIWIFHISALIGISLGFEAWFVAKTPVNLIISSILLFLVFPIDTRKKTAVFALLWILGMLAEWVGVKYGILFGSYEYGANLGPKLDGVPYLIGVNWALLSFITARLAQYLFKKSVPQLIFAALLMLVLDFFMEQSAPRFDFWEFDKGLVPLSNYICWLAVALIFQYIIHRTKITGDIKFSAHLYTAQLVFFLYFFLWF